MAGSPKAMVASTLRAWRGCLAVVLCCGAGLRASGAETASALQFDVFLGHDGIVREGTWFPVVCELKNDGPPFTAVIEVSASVFSQGQPRRANVELPTGTLKRLVIPVFCTSRGYAGWDARLRDDRGKVRAEQLNLRPRRLVGWETTVVGALTRTPGGAPTLRPVLPKQPDVQPAVARWQPSIFPDNPLVLEGLDLLYLSSERATELKSPQTRAVLRWLHAGGHLVIGVDDIGEVNALPWLRNLLPCALETNSAVNHHPELHQWLRSAPGSAGGDTTPPGPAAVLPTAKTGARPAAGPTNVFAGLAEDLAFELASLPVATGPLTDGQALVSAEGKPLIVTAPRGRGRVTALLFSPEREPVRSWKHLPSFWAKLAEVPPALYTWASYAHPVGWSTDGIFGAMVDTWQVRKLPVPWLLLLLVVYLLVIGPLDHWWLKRIGKPMLTWITFPCYVLLFSLLIYFIGYKLRAGETEWNELHLVDVLPAGGQAELRGRTYASIYSPVNATYRVEGRQQFAAFRSEFRGGWAGSHESERGAVLQAGDHFTAEIFVPVWTSQLYVNDWWQPSPRSLDLRVQRQGEGYLVAVENRLDRALAHARLVVAARVFDLGELPAGQTKRFTLSPTQGRPLKEFVAAHGGSFLQVTQARQRAFGSSSSAHLTDLPAASQAASFVSQLGRDPGAFSFIAPPGLDLSAVVERGQALLLAWAGDYAPVPPLNQFKPRRTARHTLFRLATAVEPLR